MPDEEKGSRHNKSRSASEFNWMILAILLIFLAVLGRQEYKIYQINKEAEATRQRVEQLQKVQADLEAERKRLYDPKYIEKLAREDHNMVGKNEVPLFIVREKDASKEAPEEKKSEDKKPEEKKEEKKAEQAQEKTEEKAEEKTEEKNDSAPEGGEAAKDGAESTPAAQEKDKAEGTREDSKN